jgi:hypothetical protein
MALEERRIALEEKRLELMFLAMKEKASVPDMNSDA